MKGRIPHPDERSQPPPPPPPLPTHHAVHGGKRPVTAGKAPLLHHGKKTLKKPKRPRETAEVALEQVLKKRDELQKAERRAGNAVSKDFFTKRWKTEIWTKVFKEMVDRMIRTLRDRISSTTRVMTKSRMDLIRFNMLPQGEDRHLFHFDLQRGQHNKTMNTLETMSIIGVLEYTTPLGVPIGTGQLAGPVSFDAMHVKVFLCCGENNSDEYEYNSEEAFRTLVHFVRACTSKRNKGDPPSAAAADGEVEDEDVNDAAEDTIASFSQEQRKFFMDKFLSFAIDYLCQLSTYMDETLKPKNQFIEKVLLYQYSMVALCGSE